MRNLFRGRDLGSIAAIAAVAFVALAIFAWTEKTTVVDPEGLSFPIGPGAFGKLPRCSWAWEASGGCG